MKGIPSQPDFQRYLQGQHALVRQLLLSKGLEDAAPGFLATVGRLLGWPLGGLWEVVPGEETLSFVSGWDDGSIDSEPLWEASRGVSLEAGVGLPGRAWESGEVTWITDLASDPGLPRGPVATELGLEAGLAIPVPIGTAERVLAVAEFFTPSLEGPAEELMGLVVGFTDELAMFIGRARAERAFRESGRSASHLAAVVTGTQDAVLSKDLNGILLSWNRAAERLYGYTAEEAIGREVEFLIPPDRQDEEERILEHVRRGERMVGFETERLRRDGTRIDVSLTVSPISSPMLGIVGASVVARDITAEKRRRRAQEFLSRASRALDTSLDPRRTAKTIVGTAVPELAELCVIDFQREDGSIGDSVIAAVDPGIASTLEEIRRRSPLDPRGSHPVAQVLREGRAMVWRDLHDPAVVDDVAQSDEHRRFIAESGYNSAAVVRLVARGRVLGTLSFLHVLNDHRYDEADLALLEDLGARAAMALDNARLYAERAHIADTLQLALRPATPASVEGLDSAVVFEAAGEGIEVGGDFYDVMPVGEDCWVAIGDVAGKGSVAAAVSVAVRNGIRALVRENDDPVVVLDCINGFLQEDAEAQGYFTAILTRMTPEGSGWSVELACAGHPPAVLLSGTGVEPIGGGAMLGVWPQPLIDRHRVRLEPGDTLVLYTDGWLEVGPAECHLEPEAMTDFIRANADCDPGELVDRLHRHALARGEGSLRDDLVVLVLRGGADVPAPAGAAAGREELAGRS